MKKKLAIFLMTILVSLSVISPVEASFSQTENSKTLTDFKNGFAWVKAYAAFDRVGSNMGASKTWDYKAKVDGGTQNVNGGRLTMKITSFASLRTGSGAGLSVGFGKKSTTVGGNSSATWTTVYSVYSQSSDICLCGELTKNSNVVVSPRKDFRSGTAGIAVEGSFKEKGTNRQISITAAA